LPFPVAEWQLIIAFQKSGNFLLSSYVIAPLTSLRVKEMDNMKRLNLLWIAFAVFLSGTYRSGGELRSWTDDKGKTIRAEHVHTGDGKVVLRLEDGSQIKVSLDSLSEKDRRYAVLLTPPRLEISVSPSIDRENVGVGRDFGPGAQVQQETVVLKVGIRKSSPAPYEAPLRAEIYMLGRTGQGDVYVLLDRTVSRFRFLTASDTVHELSSDTVKIRQVETGRDTGVEYFGYLVVVTDVQGRVLEMKCSRLDLERNAEAIRAAQEKTTFDSEFNTIERERKNSDVQQGRQPQRRPDRHRVPDRRF
jgi:hypothetical protein